MGHTNNCLLAVLSVRSASSATTAGCAKLVLFKSGVPRKTCANWRSHNPALT